jgi:hypothetical protein
LKASAPLLRAKTCRKNENREDLEGRKELADFFGVIEVFAVCI